MERRALRLRAQSSSKRRQMMNRHTLFRAAVALMTATALALSFAPAALAQPANDNFSTATSIGTLPFTDGVDITFATTEFGEPFPCGFIPNTVWYAITPGSNTLIRVDENGSNFGDTYVAVYQDTGSGITGLLFQGCATFGSSLTVNVQSGTTYYIQAGRIFCCGGILQLNVQEILPPPNDAFANATTISALPFTQSIDSTAATTEAGEPTPSCAVFYGPVNKTAWLAFTPATSGSISANVFNTPFSPVVAAYTGSALNNLTEVGSRCFGGLLTFHANAGTTYYLQVGGLFGQGGPLQFQLDVTPPPVAQFGFFPGDPSSFDTIQFFNQSFDPGQVGFQSQAWDFGDGATGTGCCPTHRYAADGDYTVQLTVTTVDGRTASTSQTVQVRTHDVGITKLSAPQAASAGQTRQITVGIRNTRYPETVRVELYRSVPGGFNFIGFLEQSVPVRPSNRTTNFSFSYTFTSDDANVGKVTFRAVASIVGHRDAFPADNEAISSPPTKVSR
jgi:PKD repeat protein